MQMKALEAELGTRLFDRSTRPPALTAEAKALMPAVDAVLAGYDRLLLARDPGPEVTGLLRLGVVPSVMTALLPESLAQLRHKYPALHVELTMGLSAELVERMQAGSLDAAVVSELRSVPRGMTWSPFLKEPLVLIVPVDAPGLPAIDLIARYPFIRYTRQAWVGELIDRLLKRRRIRVNESMTLDTLEAVTAMVHHGLGVSVVPMRSIAPLSPVRQVALPKPAVFRVVGLLHRRERLVDRLAGTLLAELVEAANGPRRRPMASRGRASQRRA